MVTQTGVSMTPGFLLKTLRLRIPLVRLRRTQDVQVPRFSYATTAASSRKRVTKKAYVELPVKLVTITGELSPPLPEWQGGLHAQEYAVEHHSKHQATQDLPEASPDSTTRSEKKKRVRRTGKKPEATLPPADNVPLNSLSGSVTSEATGETKTARRQPRNYLAGEILANLERFPNCILLTRVGQFYESYFEQAREVSALLSIKLTSRVWGGKDVWMCGFPLAHLDKHLKTLVQTHKKLVAMCEEFRQSPDIGTSKPTFERRVVRIVTPGTLIDESFLNPYENNYLLSIALFEGPEDSDHDYPIGLAWMDTSTGEFFTRRISIRELEDQLVRLRPSEVVLPHFLEDQDENSIRKALSEEACFISYGQASDKAQIIDTQLRPSADALIDPTSVTESQWNSLSSLELAASSLLTSYLRQVMMECAPSPKNPIRDTAEGRMQIDAHTLKSLEIRENLRDGGTTGSLMSIIKRTVTTGGTRLLSRWLCSPSTSLLEINNRQSLVSFFHQRPALSADLVTQLKLTEDIARILQRLLLNRGDHDNLLSIKHTIDIWTQFKAQMELEKRSEKRERSPEVQIEWSTLDSLLSGIVDLSQLSARIEKALTLREKDSTSNSLSVEEDNLNGIFDIDAQPESPDKNDLLNREQVKWTVHPSYSSELMQLHNHLAKLQAERGELQDKFRRQYNAASLTLRTAPNLGPFVHILKTRRQVDKLDLSEKFVPLSHGSSRRTYFNQEWSNLGSALFIATERILAMERNIINDLRNQIVEDSNLMAIKKNCRIFDELDIASSFGRLTNEMNLVKPEIRDDASFSIIDGRHPTVEMGLVYRQRAFTPNSLSFDDSSRLHIITGPNMAGKSTFLRQTALIVVLAQVGCFVPASKASIGIVDKVFSRVGARDDLFKDRSTFMVEMLETSEILKRATDRSLVIMDEVGRGTTAKDGIAIAFATAHHLYTGNACRALFATHFHEIADMLGYSEEGTLSPVFPNIRFFCSDVDVTKDGHVAYSHQLRRGVNRNSHGIIVARMSGMPDQAVKVAEDVLRVLDSSSGEPFGDREQLRLLGERLAARSLGVSDL